jgi:hypothetical protein
LRRNCLLKHVIEGKIDGRIELTGRRGRRCKQILHDLQGKDRISETQIEGSRSHSQEKRFGRGCGPVVRQPTE